jgi:hypothetical protein
VLRVGYGVSMALHGQVRGMVGACAAYVQPVPPCMFLWWHTGHSGVVVCQSFMWVAVRSLSVVTMTCPQLQVTL